MAVFWFEEEAEVAAFVEGGWFDEDEEVVG